MAHPGFAEQAGLFGDVGEGAVAIVVVEAVAGAGDSAVETAAGELENVHPSVVVVVDEGAAAAGDFENVVRSGDAAVDGGLGESGGFRDISEA